MTWLANELGFKDLVDACESVDHNPLLDIDTLRASTLFAIRIKKIDIVGGSMGYTIFICPILSSPPVKVPRVVLGSSKSFQWRTLSMRMRSTSFQGLGQLLPNPLDYFE